MSTLGSAQFNSFEFATFGSLSSHNINLTEITTEPITPSICISPCISPCLLLAAPLSASNRPQPLCGEPQVHQLAIEDLDNLTGRISSGRTQCFEWL